VPAKVITHRFVESVRPRPVRTEYPDAGCPGLYLVVQPSGTRSWAFRFRNRGVNGKKTLGRAGDGGLSLAAARTAAAVHRHRLETHPVTAVTGVTPKAEGGGDKIEAAVAAFFELHVRRKTQASTAQHTESILNGIVLPAWRGRTIGSIRRRDVIELVESVAARGRGTRANRTLSALSKLFNWLVARDALDSSPVTGVERPHKEEARARILGDDELRALWLACGHDGALGQAVQMLILVGARRAEVGHMRWLEIDEDRRLWTLPAARTKNAREHAIPLSSQAWALIEARPQFVNCPYVFSVNGKGPVNNWDRVKHRISARAGIAVDSWRLHDLRRTCASGMQKLGVQVPVIERALNHVSGTFRGIVGVYQQHDYADEARIALQKWGDHVERLVGGKPAKVVPLQRRKQLIT
jgi:integrase